MSKPRETFALLDDDGNLRAVAGPTPEWIDNFARRHRLRQSSIGSARLETVFLGRGQLDDDRVTGAFESVATDRDGVQTVVHRCDTLAEALGFHDSSVQAWEEALRVRRSKESG